MCIANGCKSGKRVHQSVWCHFRIFHACSAIAVRCQCKFAIHYIFVIIYAIFVSVCCFCCCWWRWWWWCVVCCVFVFLELNFVYLCFIPFFAFISCIEFDANCNGKTKIKPCKKNENCIEKVK